MAAQQYGRRRFGQPPLCGQMRCRHRRSFARWVGVKAEVVQIRAQWVVRCASSSAAGCALAGRMCSSF
eukprot:1669086-Ditylum_brightwellii.AAC.1